MVAPRRPTRPQVSSGLDIYIEEENVSTTLAALDRTLDPLVLSLVFLTGKVGPYLTVRAKNRFASEGDDVTGAWAPLKDATERIRASGRAMQLWTVGDSHPINRRTGELERYITGGNLYAYPTSVGASLQFPKPSGKKSIREKMRTAQRGKASPNTVPRPVLGLNSQDGLFMLAALAGIIKDATR